MVYKWLFNYRPVVETGLQAMRLFLVEFRSDINVFVHKNTCLIVYDYIILHSTYRFGDINISKLTGGQHTAFVTNVITKHWAYAYDTRLTETRCRQQDMRSEKTRLYVLQILRLNHIKFLTIPLGYLNDLFKSALISTCIGRFITIRMAHS